MVTENNHKIMPGVQNVLFKGKVRKFPPILTEESNQSHCHLMLEEDH